MQPASAGSATGNRNLKRWAPIAGVAVVAAVVIGIVAATGSDDKTAVPATSASVSAATAAPTAPVTTAAAATAVSTASTGANSTIAPGPATTIPVKPTFPMSFAQAKAAGLDGSIDWGKRCDTTSGRLAVPDFFAPECFAPFTGDNGGATSPGVTADQINVVYYQGIDNDPIINYVTDAVKVDDTTEQQAATMKELIRYYQTYYELYGRTVNLIPVVGTGIATDEVAARADAARIAEEFKPFVVFGGPALTSAFADELAARKVMCIGCTPGQPPKFYAVRDPYVWGLDGGAAQKLTHVVEVITKQLIGKPASHGGDAVKATPRTFGLLYLESSTASKELADSAAAAMAAAGAPFAQVVAYQLDPATIQQTALQAITKMKAAGVTTIVFSGDPVAPRDFTNEATAQEYFPEWLVAASTLVDVTAFARTYDQQQWQHAFGVTQLAARTDATKIGAFALYKWFTGVDPPADGTIGVFQPNPALFFRTVQGVGPNLSPETFRDALFASAGTQAAISQPYLSYGSKGYWPEPDYQGVDDATEIWWDPNATGPDELRRTGQGMYQFVDGGKRYLPGAWPSDDKLFNPTGAVAFYGTPPPGEDPPKYPSPAG